MVVSDWWPALQSMQIISVTAKSLPRSLAYCGCMSLSGSRPQRINFLNSIADSFDENKTAIELELSLFPCVTTAIYIPPPPTSLAHLAHSRIYFAHYLWGNNNTSSALIFTRYHIIIINSTPKSDQSRQISRNCVLQNKHNKNKNLPDKLFQINDFVIELINIQGGRSQLGAYYTATTPCSSLSTIHCHACWEQNSLRKLFLCISGGPTSCYCCISTTTTIATATDPTLDFHHDLHTRPPSGEIIETYRR